MAAALALVLATADFATVQDCGGVGLRCCRRVH